MLDSPDDVISGTQAQSSDDIQYLCYGSCPSKPIRSPLIEAAMSMTRVGSGQTGAAVNLWLSSQHPKKAETARLPKNKPIRFWIPQLREQVKTPANPVLVDRLTHAITFLVVSSELSAHAKTLHIPLSR